MGKLRAELAVRLDSPTLETEGDDGQPKHGMTYNWYELGARLVQHLDKHHKETNDVNLCQYHDW